MGKTVRKRETIWATPPRLVAYGAFAFAAYLIWTQVAGWTGGDRVEPYTLIGAGLLVFFGCQFRYIAHRLADGAPPTWITFAALLFLSIGGFAVAGMAVAWVEQPEEPLFWFAAVFAIAFGGAGLTSLLVLEQKPRMTAEAARSRASRMKYWGTRAGAAAGLTLTSIVVGLFTGHVGASFFVVFCLALTVYPFLRR